jgi:hypothetical protein
MEYICITSMNEKHINGIGKYMLESWEKFWPDNSILIVYLEGCTRESSKNIKFVSWEDSCQEKWKNFCQNEQDVNSRRFAKKGFSFLHAMKEYKNQAKIILWIDADILLQQNISTQLIKELLPQKKLVALFDCYYQRNPDYTESQYLDTNERKKFGAESGLVLLNTTHKDYDEYVENYEDLYTSSVKHESLTSWYDGEIVLSAARNFLDQVEDLSKLRTTNKTQTPLNRSKLSTYMTHMKGKVKKKRTNADFKEIINRK